MDPAAKRQAVPDAILAASWCALAAIVDLIAVLFWAVVQSDSVELVNRHAAIPDRACTARLDRIRNIDMCTQNTPHMGIESRAQFIMYSGGGDHRSTTDNAATHGLCNNAYCPACRGPRHCVCADGDEGHPRPVMIARSSVLAVMQQSGIWRTPRTSTNQAKRGSGMALSVRLDGTGEKLCTIAQPKAQVRQL